MKRSNVVRLDAYRQDEAKRRIVELLIEQGERETVMEAERNDPTPHRIAAAFAVATAICLAAIYQVFR